MNDVIWNGTRYFFEQKRARCFPRREKKNLDDLPPSVKYGPLKTKANTTSSTRSGDDLPDGASEAATHDASADEKPNTLHEVKDSLAGGDAERAGPVSFSESVIASSLAVFQEDTQRLAYENYKALALLTLARLGELLEFFSKRKQNLKLPKTVEVALLSEFKDLSCDALCMLREWQTLTAKNSWDNESKRKNRDSSDESKSVIDSVSIAGDSTVDVRIMKPENSGRLSATPSITGGSRNKLTSRSKILGNISENDEAGRPGSRSSSVLNIPGKRTRLERFKPMLDQMSKTTLSDRGHASVLMEGDSENSQRSVRGYYVSVIQFALSSRDCEEKGWIVHEDNSADLERQTVLEWARQRLHTSIRHKNEQESKEREQGYNCSVDIVYYGDCKKDKPRPQKAPESGIPIPVLPGTAFFSGDEKNAPDGRADVLSAATNDGSTSVFYPGGQLSIMSSHAGLGRHGYYISVFDDNVARSMLANFTPCGRGTCYYRNGVVRFLSTDKEILLSDENGACQKRWKWPATMGAKLPATIQFNLNQYVVFRCVSRNQMSLTFTCGKQTINFKMTHSLVQPEPEDHGKFQSGLVFSSQSAKEITRASRKSAQSQAKKQAKKKPLINMLFRMSKNQTPKSPRESPRMRNLKSVAKRALAEENDDINELEKDNETKMENEIKEISSEKETNVGSVEFVIPGENETEQQKAEKEKAEAAEAKEASAFFELESERELHELAEKIKKLVATWMTHYRSSVGMVPKGRSPSPNRRSKSAKSTPDELFRQLTPSRRVSPSRRAGTAPVTRDLRPHTATGPRPRTSLRPDSRDQTLARITPVTPTPSKTPRGQQESDEEQRRRAMCPVALRYHLLTGEEDWMCRCSKHRMPSITDVEYDFFIQHFTPPTQMTIVCITSSLYPRQSSGAEYTLEQVYVDTNRNRSNPCTHSLADPYRVLRYDMATCTEGSDHTQPLLMCRHNVVPGMMLMYQDGKLLFCDHIFNGYGNTRKDFTKQVMKTRREAKATGASLPDDFRFSPQMGRRGARAAWGGQIGGAGVDRYASPGLDARGTYVPQRRCPSASTNTSSEGSLPVCARNKPQLITAETLLSSTYSTSYPASYPYPSSPGGQDPPPATDHAPQPALAAH